MKQRNAGAIIYFVLLKCSLCSVDDNLVHLPYLIKITILRRRSADRDGQCLVSLAGL